MLSNFLLIPPELTLLIEALQGFQDFNPALRTHSACPPYGITRLSKSKDATKGYVEGRAC